MSLETEGLVQDTTPEDGELVHWMEPGRLQVGAAGVAAAFAIGAAAALGALLAFRWIAPRREGLPPWKWARGPIH
jgi:hypothetical protein